MSAEAWARHVELKNPQAMSLFTSATREDFLDAAERCIEKVVGMMERSRATYRKLDERDLSKLVVELLGDLVPAEAEAHTNGHVDVSIRHPRGLLMRHITECKIWNGIEYHVGGMKQVLGYARGREGRVMVLEFFVRHKRMAFLMERLRGDLATHGEVPFIRPAVTHPSLVGAFATAHEHPSGYELEIVHFGCHLWDEGVEEPEE